MSLIPNLSEIPDRVPVEPGEYDLRITSAKEKKFNSGRYGITLAMDIVGEDNAQTVFHNLLFGNFKDFREDEQKSLDMWQRVKKFVIQIGLDADNEISEEDLVGLELTAELLYNDGMATDENGNTVKVSDPRNELGRIL